MASIQWWGVAAVFLLAGGVKGVTGMGLPTVAVSLLGLWMAPAQAAALLVVPALATNFAQCLGPNLRPLVARLWPGWLAIGVVTVLAPGLGGGSATSSAGLWLGVVLVAYGLWGLSRPGLPDLSGTNRWWGTAVGAATGVVTAATAVFVVPWVPYLQSLKLDKEAMVQALGLSFTVATLALAARLGLSMHVDVTSVDWLVLLAAALAGAFGGLKLGELLRGRLAGATFQKLLFVVFIALGLANLARAAGPAGDPVAGKRAFQPCASCHQVGPSAHAGFGPPLNGIVGRAAGSFPGYGYSDAMRRSKLVWTEPQLAAFIQDADRVVPGTKMRFWSLGYDDRKLADLIAYLKTFP